MLNAVIRALSMIILGVLLVSEKDTLTLALVECLGVAIIVPGLFSLISQLRRWREKDKIYFWFSVLSSLVCVVIGFWLLFAPGNFIMEMILLLGLLLIALGIYQFYMFWYASRYISVPPLLYLLPALLVVAGIFVLTRPEMSVSLVLLVVGVGLIIGGAVELLRIKYKREQDSV